MEKLVFILALISSSANAGEFVNGQYRETGGHVIPQQNYTYTSNVNGDYRKDTRHTDYNRSTVSDIYRKEPKSNGWYGNSNYSE